MTDLIACVSSDSKGWNHITRLIEEGEWNKVFLVCEDGPRQKFKQSGKIEFIAVDFSKPVFDLINDISSGLRYKINDMEVALNIVSGNGKEHMALLSAVLKLGVGIRLVAVTKEGIKEI
ncbi:MAG TPA: hypothetical protein VI564_03405 [Candidatus Nanoarchaeia archaeon]|nr:hypothetical protein [Candidatus Nanoarchaeia archaeon]